MQTIISTVQTKACECCGRVFTPVNSRQKYCKNPDCPMGKAALEWAEKYKRKKNVPVLNNEFVVRCELCGKQFTTPSLRYKYCSETCKRIRSNYLNRVQYAKRHGLPDPINPADIMQAKNRKIEVKAAQTPELTPPQRPTKPINPIRGIERTRMNDNQIKPHYSAKEVDEKMTAKTKKIIDTIHALESAGIDDSVVFEAIKSLTRMPLNRF